ncbi:hypothetical protein E2C01_089755 [Portunus trituberculatus]|uniref:Uncharacterized protein n=1 Tax=Portunus trituberculatus TaxID=210409 RepID=A0A5B7J9P0_PORTR|nr:hypothetical protein [Portunus trituberculatus]
MTLSLHGEVSCRARCSPRSTGRQKGGWQRRHGGINTGYDETEERTRRNKGWEQRRTQTRMEKKTRCGQGL